MKKDILGLKYFGVSYLVTIVGLGLAVWWGASTEQGWIHALTIVSLLTVLEVCLSFDNAVVNAAVLKDMSAKWQQRFLTWGILIAVFGVRFIFPLLIVSLATGLGFLEVSHLALEQPEEYSAHVLASNIDIAAFGGMFLMMVFLHFVIDASKDTHWIGPIERKLAKLGKLEAFEVVLAMTVLMSVSVYLPEAERLHALFAGSIGVVLYVFIKGLTGLMNVEEMGDATAKQVGYAGFMGFMYLQFLDASFSLDGVIGAFAISKDVVIIMLGLGIGAMFVRSMTIFLVRKGTLDEYIYLEHGAHYGIGALACIMLTSMFEHVPEVITGFIGLSFILLSLWSSVRYNKGQKSNSDNQ